MTKASDPALLEMAVEVLCDRSLAHVVDLVAWRDGKAVMVANCGGTVRILSPYSSDLLCGRDPVAQRDALAFTPLPAELADPSPPNERNSYPWAFERLSSLFEAPAAPDLVVVHTGSHHWPERGGHLGEHGSLSVVQSRAPLLLSGPGVTGRGLLEQSARVIDVGPTMAWALGTSRDELKVMEGAALDEIVEPGNCRHVVGMLWDGCNSNSFYECIQQGDLPNAARLFDNGCALRGGAIAEFPSVTLVNHTSALTGVGPGAHGIVNNAYFDRRSAVQVLTNNATTWHRWSEWLSPGVRTVFEMVDGPTASVNEPVDTGADYSTFALVRAQSSGGGASSMTSRLPDPLTDPHASHAHVEGTADYAWSTAVDALGLQQMLELWSGSADPPRLTWWNTTLTDTGHHAGGPHAEAAKASMRDADARLGAFLDHLDRRGLLEHTMFVLTSDHGSEGADPSCHGDWDQALRDAGVSFRDEAYGFIYLGEDPSL